MVEKCLEYLKVAGQGFEVKKISLDQQRMMLKELIYEGLKSLLMSQMLKDWETRSCKHISQCSQNCGVPGLGVSVWKSGIAEGVWMSTSPKHTPSSGRFFPLLQSFLLLMGIRRMDQRCCITCEVLQAVGGCVQSGGGSYLGQKWKVGPEESPCWPKKNVLQGQY